jgi:hypothetical protein
MDESDVAQTCAALAHAKRIAILMLLQRQDNGLAVGEIAVALGLRQNSVSSPLKILSIWWWGIGSGGKSGIAPHSAGWRIWFGSSRQPSMPMNKPRHDHS